MLEDTKNVHFRGIRGKPSFSFLPSLSSAFQPVTGAMSTSRPAQAHKQTSHSSPGARSTAQARHAARRARWRWGGPKCVPKKRVLEHRASNRRRRFMIEVNFLSPPAPAANLSRIPAGRQCIARSTSQSAGGRIACYTTRSCSAAFFVWLLRERKK